MKEDAPGFDDCHSVNTTFIDPQTCHDLPTPKLSKHDEISLPYSSELD